MAGPRRPSASSVCWVAEFQYSPDWSGTRYLGPTRTNPVTHLGGSGAGPKGCNQLRLAAAEEANRVGDNQVRPRSGQTRPLPALPGPRSGGASLQGPGLERSRSVAEAPGEGWETLGCTAALRAPSEGEEAPGCAAALMAPRRQPARTLPSERWACLRPHSPRWAGTAGSMAPSAGYATVGATRTLRSQPTQPGNTQLPCKSPTLSYKQRHTNSRPSRNTENQTCSEHDLGPVAT